MNHSLSMNKIRIPLCVPEKKATHLSNVSCRISVCLLFWNVDPFWSLQHGLAGLFLFPLTNRYICCSLFDFVLDYSFKFDFLGVWMVVKTGVLWCFVKLCLALFVEWKVFSVGIWFVFGWKMSRQCALPGFGCKN